MPRNRYYSGPESDHFDGRFFNTAPPIADKGLRDIWRWRRTSTPSRWPDAVPVAPAVPEARCKGLRITIVGHACVLIQLGGLNLVTDPLWSERASPFSFAGPRRICPPGIAFDDLPRIDAVLLSHNHYDHLDKASLRRLVERDDPRILTPLGNDTIVKQAVPRARVETGDWWDGFALDDGVEATIVPAQHWSARGPRDRRMALWGGFYVRSAQGSAYFAGDTGYGDGSIFPAIRERLGTPDAALLPIGAYAPRWFMADQHIDPDEAVRIMQALGARRAIGIHWGVFQLTDEGRDDPAQLLARALAERGVPPERFAAAESGEVFDF
ncbi:MAG: MBL fold metallo-hydrolase [Novosphingobium sp.]|nr:MBL fold metallo-hydrolase [Novosphingobium sp.]